MRKISLIAISLILVSGLYFLGGASSFIPASLAGTQNLSGFAYSPAIGYISFNSKNCDTNDDGKSEGLSGCPPIGTTIPSYGVNIDPINPVTGDFSGYAWANPRDNVASSDNIGWISFNASDTSSCGPNAALNKSNGAVTGFAKALNGSPTSGWDGCIKMAGTAQNGSTYGVTIDTTTCKLAGYAWGSDVVDAIHFSGAIYGVTVPPGLCTPPAAPTLIVSPSLATVQVGGTQQYSAIYDPDGSGPQASQNVTSSTAWSSSNASVATVASGLATGRAAGSASVQATYSSLSASAGITVSSCTPTWSECDCQTELQKPQNTCVPQPPAPKCTRRQINTCRNLNWTEVNP